jgi:hypothetical protein
MNYPIYRKYKGIDVYFKIESETEFIEYKKMGNRLLKDRIIAKIFPEKQFIQDMINLYEDRWIEIEEMELLSFVG